MPPKPLTSDETAGPTSAEADQQAEPRQHQDADRPWRAWRRAACRVGDRWSPVARESGGRWRRRAQLGRARSAGGRGRGRTCEGRPPRRASIAADCRTKRAHEPGLRRAAMTAHLIGGGTLRARTASWERVASAGKRDRVGGTRPAADAPGARGSGRVEPRTDRPGALRVRRPWLILQARCPPPSPRPHAFARSPRPAVDAASRVRPRARPRRARPTAPRAAHHGCGDGAAAGVPARRAAAGPQRLRPARASGATSARTST